MAEVTQADKENFVDIFFGGFVDAELHRQGVPDWLGAHPSKILAVRANLHENPKLFGYAGWLTSYKPVTCSGCDATLEPRSEMYIVGDWLPRCPTCEAGRIELERQRDAVYRRHKHEAMLRRAEAAKERWRQANPPDPRQVDLFGVKP